MNASPNPPFITIIIRFDCNVQCIPERNFTAEADFYNGSVIYFFGAIDTTEDDSKDTQTDSG